MATMEFPSEESQLVSSLPTQLEYNGAIFKEPQCLIETEKSGKLSVRQKVLAELQKLDKPMVVVAIAGPYRTGKSYLMNRLAGVSKGFALGSTIESKTKGIWIWVTEHPKKKNTYLVLLDTEGLGDAKKGDSDHDNWVFTLAVLLSSTFVYNFLGAISEDMISKLQFISEISKKIKIHREDGDGESTDFDMHFPQLIFTARDFTLDLVIDGKEVSAEEYLEHMLSLNDSQSKESQAARRCIRQYFLKRKCFTFDRPGDRDTMKNLDNLEENALAKSFVQDTNIFTECIWNESPTLSLPSGQTVNGLMFATLVETYIEAIRLGEVPCMESAYTMMARRENEKLMDEVLNMCHRHIAESDVVPTETEEELVEVLGKMQKEAVDAFVPRAIFDADETYKRAFLEKLHEVCLQTEEENRGHSQSRCQEVLLDLGQPIKARHDNGFYTRPGGYELYTQDLEQLKQDYVQKKLGVLKMQMLAEFLEKEDTISKTILAADEKLTEEEKQREEKKKTLALQANQMMKQNEEMRQLEEKHKRQIQISEDTARRIEKKMQTEIALREKKMQELHEKRKDEHRRLEVEGQRNITELKAQTEASEIRQQQKLEKMRNSFEQDNQKYRKKKETEHEAKISAAITELQLSKRQYESKMSAMVKSLHDQHRAEMSAIERKLKETQGQHTTEILAMQTELQKAREQMKEEEDSVFGLPPILVNGIKTIFDIINLFT